MKEYDKNMKGYEEICQYIGFGTAISIWVLGLGKILPSMTACWRSLVSWTCFMSLRWVCTPAPKSEIASPPPSMTSYSGKCPGDLEKLRSLDPWDEFVESEAPPPMMFHVFTHIYHKDERSARDRKDLEHDLFCLA